MQSLTYDNLPPGSTILREWKDGTLTLTFAARQPGPAEICRASRQAALSMMWLVVALFAVMAAMLIPEIPPRQLLQRAAEFPIIVLTLICAVSTYALFWFDGRRTLLGSMKRSLAEQTVLIVSESNLGIQVQGPTREFGIVLKARDITSVTRRGRVIRMHPGSLMIRLRDSGPIELLRGYSPAELEWVARTIRQIIGQSAESPPAPAI